MKQSIGTEFWEKTKYQNLSDSYQKQGMALPAYEQPVPQTTTLIDLPSIEMFSLASVDLIRLVKNRTSLRQYTEEDLSLEEFSFLLWGTQGIKEITDYPVTKRTVPSAGSRHPFETYLLVNRVAGLASGLYRYLAATHKLAEVDTNKNMADRLTTACLKQPHVRNSAVTFFWVADILRTVWRYSERGYRYILLDAGHVCQNLYLLAEAIGCGVCGIAAYDDDLVNAALGLDGEKLFTAYIATLGKRPK